MAFLGQNPERCKIVVNSKCLQKVKIFKSLGNEISNENVRYLLKTSRIFSNGGNSKEHF